MFLDVNRADLLPGRARILVSARAIAAVWPMPSAAPAPLGSASEASCCLVML